MIVYFNNQGVMTTQLQHGSPAIRQGSSFEIDFLFEKNCPFLADKILSIRFKKSGEEEFGSEFYLDKVTENYVFEKLNSSENIYNLVDGKEYIQYRFVSQTVYNLTSKFGELEGVICIYSTFPNDNTPASAIFEPSSITRVYATGVVHLYVEKTYGSEPINYNISPTQYAYLISFVASAKSYCDKRINDFYEILSVAISGDISLDKLEFNTLGADIIVPKEDEMPSFPNFLRTGKIYSPEGELDEENFSSLISLINGSRSAKLVLTAHGEESSAEISIEGTTASGTEGKIILSGLTIFNAENRPCVTEGNNIYPIACLKEVPQYMHNITVDDGYATWYFNIMDNSDDEITTISELKELIYKHYGNVPICNAVGEHYDSNDEQIYKINLSNQNIISGSYYNRSQNETEVLQLSESEVTITDLVK